MKPLRHHRFEPDGGAVLKHRGSQYIWFDPASRLIDETFGGVLAELFVTVHVGAWFPAELLTTTE